MDVQSESNDPHQVSNNREETGHRRMFRIGHLPGDIDPSEETSVARKRIAIIGGGLCGLFSIVSLKDEGLEPVCFEYRDAPGGTWYYSDESVEGFASTMPTTVLNVSKEISAISAFPPQKECNVFMRHDEAYRYYMDYFRPLGVEKHIRYNTEVTRVVRAGDYDETGQFVVTLRDKKSGAVWSDVYDGVLVCTGHFNVPNKVEYPGQERFGGTIMHTHGLKEVEGFKGQRVLVVGNGCSGLDAAVSMSNVARKVYLSTRSGIFIVPKRGHRGYPLDHLFFRKYLDVLLLGPFRNFFSWACETVFLDAIFDHRLYCVRPKYRLLGKDPAVSDAIFEKLLSGTVVLKGGVKSFHEEGVVFDDDDDGEKVTEIDSVVLATGYRSSFPYLEEGLFETSDDGLIHLYKCMFPPQLPKHTLAFIGFFNVFGPGVPIAELQARWTAHVLAGKVKLPSQHIMLDDAIERHRSNSEIFTPSEFMTVRVDHMAFCDEIAHELGVKPNLLKYLFTDFRLFLKLVFGPFLPYQYRLQGPHRWDGAREAIMTSNERLMWSLSRGKVVHRSFLEKTGAFLLNLIPKDLFF